MLRLIARGATSLGNLLSQDALRWAYAQLFGRPPVLLSHLYDTELQSALPSRQSQSYPARVFSTGAVRKTTPPDEGESLSSPDAQLGQLSATWDPIAAPPAQKHHKKGQADGPRVRLRRGGDRALRERAAAGVKWRRVIESHRRKVVKRRRCASPKSSRRRARTASSASPAGELSARERAARDARVAGLPAIARCCGAASVPELSDIEDAAVREASGALIVGRRRPR